MGVVYTRINDGDISGTPSRSFNVVYEVYEVVIQYLLADKRNVTKYRCKFFS